MGRETNTTDRLKLRWESKSALSIDGKESGDITLNSDSGQVIRPLFAGASDKKKSK